MGLVTVALLTLAPLALRPVRLACLIHAANVHSEPGSNPSKVCMTGPVARTGHAPQRVEESDWSHRDASGRRTNRPRETPRCRFRETAAAPTPRNQGAVRSPDGLSPAPLKGSQLTKTTIDRIVKECAAPRRMRPERLVPVGLASFRPSLSCSRLFASGENHHTASSLRVNTPQPRKRGSCRGLA
jgi:hypothetical protein